MKKNFFRELFARKKNDGEEAIPSFSDVAEKLSKYFSTEPEKEKVLRNEDFDAAGDTYYATVSARYKVLSRLFLTLLVIFVLISLIFNIRNITYDNFFYLMKDFSAAAESDGLNYETLSYDATSEQSFALYRGGLAVASRSNVSAFTSTGRRTLNNNAVYSKPYVVTSDKYMLVSDMGSGSFAVYNSFAKIYSESLDYPVTAAAFADNGSFALLTRSEEHESVVLLYDGDFKRLARYSKGLYALDLAIDKNGETLGVIYVGTESGVVSTYVVFYDLKRHEKLEETVYSREFPLSCSFRSDGGFSVVTDSSVILFDKRHTEEYVSASFAARSVSGIYTDRSYSAVSHNDGVITDINEILVFDKSGKLVYNETIQSDIEELCVFSGYIFIKNSSGVLRVRMKDSSQQQLNCQSGRMLIYDEETALVCTQSKAVYLKFDD